MSNVNRVQGPSGPAGPNPDKKVKGPDEDHFKKLMKVEKVSETDPEQKKKRRQPAEEAEEDAQLPEDSSHVPLFSLSPEEENPSTPVTSTPPKTFATAASTGPVSIEPQEGDERFTEDNLPDLTSDPTNMQQKPSSSNAPLEKNPNTQAPSSSKDPVEQAKDKKTTKAKTVKQEVKKAPLTTPKIKTPTLTSKKTIEKQTPLAQEKSLEEVSAKQLPENIVAPTVDKPVKKAVKDAPISKVETPIAEAPVQAPSPIPVFAVTPSGELQPHYVYLPPQIAEIFDRMVGVVTVMNQSGITQTTITLNSPHFTTSPFFGAQITLTEYSTAPKAYNVTLVGSPQAVNVFAKNQEGLLSAFQGGNYAFKINRIETSLSSESKPLFRRKEGDAGTKNDNQNSEKDERNNS